jgi:hypothetical protein
LQVTCILRLLLLLLLLLLFLLLRHSHISKIRS